MNRVFVDRLVDDLDRDEAEKIIKMSIFNFNENEPEKVEIPVEEKPHWIDHNSLQRSLEVVPKDQVEMEEDANVDLNFIDPGDLNDLETHSIIFTGIDTSDERKK